MALVVVLCLIVGLSLVATTAAINGRMRRSLLQRIDSVAQISRGAAAGPDKALRSSRLAVIADRMFTFGLRQTWGVQGRGRAMLIRAFAAAIIVLVIFAAVLKFPPWLVGPLCLAAFFGVPRVSLAREQKRVEATFTDLFPGAIDLVIRMLRAGLPISAAIRAVASEGPPRVDKVFARIADQTDIGVPLPDALAEQSRRINLADFRFFAIAVNLQHTTGGNLTLTLEILADIIRRRRGARMRAKAVTAEVRMTAYVLAGIPIFVVAALLVFDPGYLSPLLHDPRGNVVAAAAGGSLTAGLVMMRQMMSKAMRV